MKYFILLILISLFILGCSTPPWNDDQIEKFKEQEVECVPLLVIETN